MGNGVLAGVNLDLPNTEQPQEVQDKVDRNNVKELSDKMKRTGITELFNVIQTQVQTIATGAFVDITDFPKAFVTSGGFVRIDGSIQVVCGSTAGDLMQLQLEIDGSVVDSAIIGSDGTDFKVKVPLMYQGFLVPGKHTVSFKAVARLHAGAINRTVTDREGYSIFAGSEIVL